MFKNCWCDTNTQHEPGFCFKTQKYPYWLLMCFKTPFYFKTADIYFEGEAGDCLLHPPGIYFEHGPIDLSASFVNDWISFIAEDADILPLQLPTNKCIQNRNTNIFTHGIQSVLAESVAPDTYSPTIISNSIQNILLTFKRISASDVCASSLDFQSLNSARIQILGNAHIPWTLDSMAKLSGYSTSHFCKLYKNAFGTSPINDLILQRIQKAKQLLILHSYTITEISELCGFSSVHYFSKLFKQIVGVSPTAYK